MTRHAPGVPGFFPACDGPGLAGPTSFCRLFEAAGAAPGTGDRRPTMPIRGLYSAYRPLYLSHPSRKIRCARPLAFRSQPSRPTDSRPSQTLFRCPHLAPDFRRRESGSFCPRRSALALCRIVCAAADLCRADFLQDRGLIQTAPIASLKGTRIGIEAATWLRKPEVKEPLQVYIIDRFNALDGG